MKITILGGGPAGLYAGLLIKKANPAHEITVIERNTAEVTYGWGVVFSDRTLASFQRADYRSYEQISGEFVIWDAIDVHYRGETIRCGGHVIAGFSRKALLRVLQERCRELGIRMHFGREIDNLDGLEPYDLLIAADGINSIARKTLADTLQPVIRFGKARYIWLGANKVLDAFTFIFCQNEHGLFQVHAYPFSGTTSTFLVECDEASWLNAGLDTASEAESLAYCQRLLTDFLGDAKLLSNNSKWISFPELKTSSWHHRNIVLLGDAAHTAHFSIGSGTRLAMEDAIALASALEQHSDLETALNAYELERKPVVEIFQRAAAESQAYFETLKRSLNLEPMPFAFQLLTRSGRITYDDLRFRDVHFGEAVDRWFAQQAFWDEHSLPVGERPARLFASSPMFNPLRLRSLRLPNRLALALTIASDASGEPREKALLRIQQDADRGAGLMLIETAAVSAQGRITPHCAGIYTGLHVEKWAELAAMVHTRTGAKLAIELNHAGRRGSTRPREEGLDRPLREHNWPLLAPSPIPYTFHSQTPEAMQFEDMERVRQEFARSTRRALEAGLDMVQVNMARGYLLASFLSPLSNRRDDDYGSTLEKRLRFPLAVFDAVRAAWPDNKPLSVALNASDCVKGGFTIEEAIEVARLLKAHGCDILAIQAGQTVPGGEPAYGRGYLTRYSERIRNEAAIPTLVGGYLTTSDEVNTLLAAGRADLCEIDVLN